MKFGFSMIWVALVAMGARAEKKQRKPKLTVFILAGQSNMEGKGSIRHLGQLTFDPATEGKYHHLWDFEANDDWFAREDVYITFNGERQGKLTPRYGVPSSNFGPELQFGHVVGNAYNRRKGDKVLLIKCAWGGKDLAIDFRPPSAGLGNYTKFVEQVPYTKEEYGVYYRKMMGIIKDTLGDIGKVIPDFNPRKVRVILSGFVWFQGFNDLINDEKTAEYGSNLVNLIRDVRSELNEPDLPVVIGGLGMDGVDSDSKSKAKNLNFRNIQRTVTLMDEFKNNTKYARTSIYVRKDKEAFNGGYHYFGRADTFFNIGRNFGKMAIKLIRRRLRQSLTAGK